MKRNRARAAMAAFLLMMLLMGCGGGGEETAEATIEATAAVATEPTEEPTKPPPVVVAQGTAEANSAGAVIVTVATEGQGGEATGGQGSDPNAPALPTAMPTVAPTDTPAVTDTPPPTNTAVPPTAAPVIVQPTAIPPTATAIPATATPQVGANGLVASNFAIQSRAELTVNGSVWFEFTVANNTGGPISYNAIGVMPRKNGVDRPDWYQQSYGGRNSSVDPGGFSWEDRIKLPEAGAYTLRLVVCFDGYDTCLQHKGTWHNLSGEIPVTIQ